MLFYVDLVDILDTVTAIVAMSDLVNDEGVELRHAAALEQRLTLHPHGQCQIRSESKGIVSTVTVEELDTRTRDLEYWLQLRKP